MIVLVSDIVFEFPLKPNCHATEWLFYQQITLVPPKLHLITAYPPPSDSHRPCFGDGEIFINASRDMLIHSATIMTFST